MLLRWSGLPKVMLQGALGVMQLESKQDSGMFLSRENL